MSVDNTELNTSCYTSFLNIYLQCRLIHNCIQNREINCCALLVFLVRSIERISYSMNFVSLTQFLSIHKFIPDRYVNVLLKLCGSGSCKTEVAASVLFGIVNVPLSGIRFCVLQSPDSAQAIRYSALVDRRVQRVLS